MRYETIDHPADIGIRSFGENLKELFATAAYAMFDILADLSKVAERVGVELEVRAGDLEELLHGWLSELLYRYEVEELLLKRFDIRKIDRGMIAATCWGELRDPDKHSISTEIKSVTYHQLKVERSEEGWIAEVIFDI